MDKKRDSKTKIRFLLFDLNDTVLKHRHLNILLQNSTRIFGFKVFKALKEFNKLKDDYGIGKINDRQIAEKVLEAANKDKKLASEVTRIYRSNVVEMPKMLDLLKELKSKKTNNTKKYKIVLLAGDGTEGIIFKRKTFHLDKYFDKIICTSDLKLHKTNKQFYITSLKMIKAKPEQCIFIDDNKKFIATAESVGIKTIRFQGERNLRRDLKNLKIL